MTEEKMNQCKNQFENHKFLNIETFRRNGQGVRTPVWFVEDGGEIFIRTGANSGKVKRIRKNPEVHLAPCRADGTVIGEWIPARGREIADPETEKIVDGLLGKKYGIQKNLFAWMSHMRGDQYTVLKIELHPT
jgi:PPOX class probable F420-dependent enzyme